MVGTLLFLDDEEEKIFRIILCIRLPFLKVDQTQLLEI